MELLQSEGRAQTSWLLAMAQPSGPSLGKLQTVRFKDPSLETWMGGTDWTVCWLNSLDQACRCPQEGLWASWNQATDRGWLFLMQRAIAAGHAHDSCPKLAHLSHNGRGHTMRGVIPSHSWQLACTRHLTPSQGLRHCLSTVGTRSGDWLAGSSHPTVALETNLCTQQ